MDDALLPAIHDVVTPAQSCSIPQNYQEVEAWQRAHYVDNRKTGKECDREINMKFQVSKKFIPMVFQRFQDKLKSHIRNGHEHLRWLRGYTFLISAKNWKYELFSDTLGETISEIKSKVTSPPQSIS